MTISGAALKGVFAWNMNKNNGLDFGTDFSKISSWGVSVNEEGKIAEDDRKAKLLAQIATLERKLANEKQPRRKREYFEQIKKLKEQI